MHILWLCLLLSTVSAQAGFGKSYLKNSRLCHQWNCLNEKLGFHDELPSKNHSASVIRSLLPSPWTESADAAVEVCYGDRPRKYTNTCPGQALLHCVVDQLIQNCPAENWRKDDGCAPLSSLAGYRYMFSQRYNNLEKNLPIERRPAWFLRNYFSTKCCELPELFSEITLSSCNFTKFMNYHIHDTQPHLPLGNQKVPVTSTPQTTSGDILKVVDFKDDDKPDPLECCDMSDFIPNSWRHECDFQLTWDPQNRLTIKNSSAFTTTTESPNVMKVNNVKIVPLTCEQENCIFRSLNIVSESGVVDMDAFKNLLHNMTYTHTTWTKAKARVVTKCLSKPIRDYDNECEINKVLACTFDVLTENCPFANKADPCKHNNSARENMICQISSSKYRPKDRRQFCGIPNMVDPEVLSQCGVKTLSRLEYVTDAVYKPKQNGWLSSIACQDLKPSTKCLMKKMGVLNKYQFLDYFKIKNMIEKLNGDWSPLVDVYNAVYLSSPLYKEHCSSSKKLLNVVDAMLITCPYTKRKTDGKCQKIFKELVDADPQQFQKEKLDQMMMHFQHVFLPPKPKSNRTSRVVKSPRYDFSILNLGHAPLVKIVDVKPGHKTVVILPVYQRMPYNVSAVPFRPYNTDSAWRSTFLPQRKLTPMTPLQDIPEIQP